MTDAGLQKPSVLQAKNNIASYSEAKFRRDALLGNINTVELMNMSKLINCVWFIAIERCAGEVITEILEVVENYDPDEAQMQLVMRG